MPTQQPSMDDSTPVQGYVQYEYWDGVNCDGTKTYITGYATDTCTVHSSGAGSYKVEFDDGE